MFGKKIFIECPLELLSGIGPGPENTQVNQTDKFHDPLRLQRLQTYRQSKIEMSSSNKYRDKLRGCDETGHHMFRSGMSPAWEAVMVREGLPV